MFAYLLQKNYATGENRIIDMGICINIDGRMWSEFSVEANIGQQQVTYRNTSQRCLQGTG